MELRQLEYFVAVAEEGSFTRGARRVRVAQSAVSATIQKLERELGMPLFSRDAAGAALTEAGMALLPEARGMLSAERRARDTVDQVRGGLRGTIRLGTLTSIGVRPASRGLLVVDLPQVLGRFHVTHPLVTFTLRTAPRGSADHLDAVLAGELDLAMVGATDRVDGIRLHHLGHVRWSFVCSRRHRLADASSVRLADLAEETFIDFPRGWGNRTMTDRAFAAAGIIRAIPFEAADQETALGLVRNGLGVTLLPRVGSQEEGVSVIDVEDCDLDLPVAMATPLDRQPSAATSALLASIIRAAGRPAGP
ncbi:LysR family transcriptional regulator [Micromonospora andamanensis]|uniref:LysR family transcriptional regulator n=1 Tax=Micromonospora andamanensis TaxID=1287068 RepID=UPI0019502143|nr:LysR family transcriptional regulator [Micromonospora andamanensis]